MRRAHALLMMVVAALVIAAASCGGGGGECGDDLFGDCTGGGGAGGGSSGGGGTGGGTPCVVEDCAPGNDCQEAACLANQCGHVNRDDGATCGVDGKLTCKAGVCEGCMAPEDCTPQECHAVACTGTSCEYALDVAGGCGVDGTGSCSAQGACGLCDDKKKNGAETGVDCGADTQCGKCHGDPCAEASECKTGFCVDGVCCDTACDGACAACTTAITGDPAGKDGTCAPFAPGAQDPDGAECDDAGGCGLVAGFCACNDGVVGGDETGVDCGGACGATCTIGQGCSTKADCESGSSECVDGVCCDTACDDACFSCALPGKEGLCLPFAGLDPGACDGVERCSPDGVCGKAPGESCGPSSDCASGLCKAGKCAECDAGSPCPDGQACLDKSCVAIAQETGTFCSGPASCASGFCVDGVCCDAACDGACEACNTTYTQNQDGHCYFVISGYDPQAECAGSGLAAVCNGNGQCGQE